MEIKICPECGSEDVDFLGQETGVMSGLPTTLPIKYRCNKCGYEGSNFLIGDKD